MRGLCVGIWESVLIQKEVVAIKKEGDGERGVVDGVKKVGVLCLDKKNKRKKSARAKGNRISVV
jgi:hypothetical protein